MNDIIMKSFYQYIFFILLSLVSISLLAQESEENKKKDGSGFGGPDQVERQLDDDNTVKPSFFELGFIQPYFDFKKNLKENTGFGYGLDYTAAYFSANKSPGERYAGSGMARFYGSWNLVGKGENNTGALNFKVDHRHKYGAIPVAAFGSELGYAGAIMGTFNDEGFRLTNFYWRQFFLDRRIAMVAGLLDPTDYLDIYMLASPWQHFTNFMFSTGSSAMYIPNDATLGIAAAGYLSDHIYLMAGLVDNNSNPTKPLQSFETFFSKNQYFTSIEIGWVSARDRQFFDNIHLTYWHSDGSEQNSAPPGWGLTFSGTWLIQDKLMPFLRGGFTEDGGTLVQKAVSAGIGFQPDWDGSLFGAAIGWGEVNESTFGENLDNQITLEVFYRLQVSTHFAITPVVQYFINPALNPDASSIFVWGIRGRLVL